MNGFSLRIFGAVAVLVLGSFSAVEAAPVIFAFEAVVTKVDELAPADLPFTVESGDVLKGRFAFEPVDAEPAVFGSPPNPVFIGQSSTDTVQKFDFSLMLDSTVVSTSSYALRVRDNSPVIDGPFFSDNISLGCASNLLSSCEPGTVPGADSSIAWGFLLPLTADGSILDGADILADPNVWNQFAGFISIGIFEQGGSGVLSIIASIEKFSVVPEPSSFCFAILASFWTFSRSFYSTIQQNCFKF